VRHLSIDERVTKSLKYLTILTIYRRIDLLKKFLELGGKDILVNQIEIIKRIIFELDKDQKRVHLALTISNLTTKILCPRHKINVFS